MRHDRTSTTRNLYSHATAVRRIAGAGFLLSVCCLLPGMASAAVGEEEEDAKLLCRAQLTEQLPLLGHRNWIVVADSAYPAQSHPSIKTVYIGGDQAAIVAEVLRAVDAAKHVRAGVYIDAESKFVSEADAPGIDAYRRKLSELLKKRPVKTMPHEDVIKWLDQAAKLYRVLILKTDMTLPYTTVFIQLDCGYWSAAAEKRLREAISAKMK